MVSVSQFAILDLGTTQLVLILLIVLLLFGAKKLPELSRSIGESARELRKGMSGGNEKEKQNDTSESKGAKS